MDERQFKNRTRQIALRVIRPVAALPPGKTADVIGRQLLRSGTSIGANYRAACRARSPADMLAKLGIVEEEADETIYWIELLVEAEIIQRQRVDDLLCEVNEILAMTVASIRTLRSRSPIQNQKSKIQNRHD